jgi:hypothetical protein
MAVIVAVATWFAPKKISKATMNVIIFCLGITPPRA